MGTAAPVLSLGLAVLALAMTGTLATAHASRSGRGPHKVASSQRTLTVSTRGPGTVTGPGISCPGDCSQAYSRRASVTLIASATDGSSFDGWSGDCSGSGPCQLTMGSDKSVSAAFTPGSQPPPLPPPPLPPPPDDGTASVFGCEWGTFSSGNTPAACWRPYSDSSPWNTRVGSSPSVVPNSAQIVNKLIGFSPTPANNNQGNADTSNDWDHPIYFSQTTDPVFTLHFKGSWGTTTWGSSPAIEGMRIHIPDAARPAGGSDHHLSVIDQESGYEYGFYDVQQKPQGGGELVAASGGRTPIDGSGTGVDASAGYFPPAAGMIRPAELEAGKIDHALFLEVHCTSGTNVYPANLTLGAGRKCSSIGLSNTDAPAIGQHFYLKMSDAEIDALNAALWQKTVLRAMAHYGMYVGDTGGAGWGIKFESGSSYTSFGYRDPWLALGEAWGVPAWHDPATDRDIRVFGLRTVVDWGSKLKVLVP